MRDDLERLATTLRTVQAQLGSDAARLLFEQQAAALTPAERARLENLTFGAPDQVADTTMEADQEVIIGDVHVSGDARIHGVVVGVNLGRIVYGRDPQEDERRRLVWYLARLAAKLYRLPLRGIEERLEQGDGLALPQVYVMLATASHREVARGQPADLRRYYVDGNPDQPLAPAYHPDQALPATAIVRVEPLVEETQRARTSEPTGRVLWRSTLATEAVQQHARLVLLGAPGSGKSTFVRHLAWTLARRGLDQADAATLLAGWHPDQRMLPILLPLRTLAGAISRAGGGEPTVFAVLRDEVQALCMQQVDDMLNAALDRGAALLLLDGLDEVPPVATATVADRQTTLQAVHAFARLYPRSPAILTCRTRAFGDDLRTQLGWHVETLAPFTLGQARHFVAAWYGELVVKRQITSDQATRMQQVLVTALEMSPKLRTMAQTPLLLTLMAVVLYNKGELPRDRPQLYERILELLLGQWDQVRDGPSLAQAIGLPDWGSERLRPLLDQLSYAAHAGATSADGRGRLDRGTLYAALIDFFQAAAVTGPGEAALRCLAYIDHRSGLLTPDTDDTYAFAHLTLQEHCAGRAMLLARDAADQVMQQRADDRWREPIFLGLGVVQQTNPWLIESVLRKLLDPEANDQPKPVARWYRDLILAAEIGADRDWAYLREQRVDVSPLQRDLKCGLVDLLADRSQPLPAAERVRAGFLLGDLGDPRVPVTLEEWRRELAQRSEQFSVPAGYFCAVRPDTYQIGGWEQNQASANIALPAFWIARFPVTVAQYAPFVAVGYGPDAERWWTREGWQWKRNRMEPWGWNEPPYAGPNQPVIGVTWYEARAFCAWLTEQMQDALPAGYVIRLPTEAEWEAAAAYDAQMQRRSYPWGEEDPDLERAIYDESKLGHPAPVGCCPAGAATCGALDMAGNVWEVTTSSHRGYPAQSGSVKEDFTPNEGDVPWRGASWWNDSTYVRCGARYWDPPDLVLDANYEFGFRVVAAPPLAQMS